MIFQIIRHHGTKLVWNLSIFIFGSVPTESYSRKVNNRQNKHAKVGDAEIAKIKVKI